MILLGLTLHQFQKKLLLSKYLTIIGLDHAWNFYFDTDRLEMKITLVRHVFRKEKIALKMLFSRNWVFHISHERKGPKFYKYMQVKQFEKYTIQI